MIVICQYDDWYNAFGEGEFKLELGGRYKVVGEKAVAGAKFYRLEGQPEDNYYLSLGFKNMRDLN